MNGNPQDRRFDAPPLHLLERLQLGFLLWGEVLGSPCSENVARELPLSLLCRATVDRVLLINLAPRRSLRIAAEFPHLLHEHVKLRFANLCSVIDMRLEHCLKLGLLLWRQRPNFLSLA